MAKKKSYQKKSYQPIWGNPGESMETCEHRFGSREECEKYAAKRMTEVGALGCGSVASDDAVNARLREDGEVEALEEAGGVGAV